MTKKEPRSVRAYGKTRAAGYEPLIKMAGYGTYPHLLEAVNSALRAHALPRNAVVIDLGYGTGNLALNILREFPGFGITGIDGSESMLAHAVPRFKKKPAVRFLCRDFGKAGWFKGLPAADAVVSSGAIHHLGDRQKRALYGQIWSLLKPGGVFISGDIIKGDTAGARAMYEDFWVTMMQKGMLKYNGKSPDRDLILARHRRIQKDEGDRPATLAAHLAWLRACGFGRVECYWKLFGFSVFGGVRGK